MRTRRYGLPFPNPDERRAGSRLLRSRLFVGLSAPQCDLSRAGWSRRSGNSRTRSRQQLNQVDRAGAETIKGEGKGDITDIREGKGISLISTNEMFGDAVR